MKGTMISAEMIAPCGLNCCLCKRALAEANPCPGCHGPNENKSEIVWLISVIVKQFVIVKQYSFFAGHHGFAFLVFMASFVPEMASAIDFYLLIFLTMKGIMIWK